MRICRIIRYFSMKTPCKTRFIDFETVTGNPSDLRMSERKLEIAANEQYIKVKAIGLNRAECLQRQGKYPPKKKEEKFLGLEASGEIYDSQGNKLFDGIALLPGGSYAEWATVNPSHVMRLPKTISFAEGAAIPEAWLTAFQILELAQLQQNSNVVIYAAASGVGTAAIQICRLLKFNPFAVVSSKDKQELCMKLGAKAVLYKDNPSWAQQLIECNNGNRFNAVLDCVGAANVGQTIELLDIDGRWILYGLLSGGKLDMNLALLLGKRISIISTTLKSRTDTYKSDLISRFSATVLPHIQNGQVKTIIHTVLRCDWSDAGPFIEGHTLMESNANAGKIIIEYTI